MRKQTLKTIAVLTAALSVSACNGFFEKDNTPTPKNLEQFRAEIRPRLLWAAHTDAYAGDEFLKMAPSIYNNTIYLAGTNGIVTAVDQATGRKLWTTNTRTNVLAGPGAGDGIVVVGSRRGEITALQANDGHTLWQASIEGEVLAAPAIGHGYVIIKTVDGNIHAFSATSGKELWSYPQTEPALILHASSTPLIRDNSLLVGFASGSLVKLTLSNGQLLWNRPVAVPQGAFAIQRMIDIDADPVVYNQNIYAATYQGSIAKLDWKTGNPLWTHDISSYTGMAPDNNSIFISDARGFVWAFNANSGLVNWRQTDLEARNVTGPASMGQYVVVGDAQGYLHWLAKSDGHFAARVSTGSAFNSAPIVENNVLYAVTNKGDLFAYTLN